MSKDYSLKSSPWMQSEGFRERKFPSHTQWNRFQFRLRSISKSNQRSPSIQFFSSSESIFMAFLCISISLSLSLLYVASIIRHSTIAYMVNLFSLSSPYPSSLSPSDSISFPTSITALDVSPGFLFCVVLWHYFPVMHRLWFLIVFPGWEEFPWSSYVVSMPFEGCYVSLEGNGRKCLFQNANAKCYMFYTLRSSCLGSPGPNELHLIVSRVLWKSMSAKNAQHQSTRSEEIHYSDGSSFAFANSHVLLRCLLHAILVAFCSSGCSEMPSSKTQRAWPWYCPSYWKQGYLN